jgi:hypothetical protein
MSTAAADKNYVWIAFFLMLAFLAGLGISIPWWYNRSLQLRAEEVPAARARWEKSGPADYDLEYMAKIDEDEPSEYHVAVRSGRVDWVWSHGGGLVLSEDYADTLGAAVGGAVWCGAASVASADDLNQQYTINAFFALIEAKMTGDVAVGGSNYATAMFDAADGHPLRYIHRVRRSTERIEINVRLLPAGAPIEIP